MRNWLILFCALTISPMFSYADEPVIVKLTQTPCVFIESEEDPKEYFSKNSNDCKAINQKTIEQRTLKTITLKPGKTIFRVTNKNVPYPLGFWLRERVWKELPSHPYPAVVW